MKISLEVAPVDTKKCQRANEKKTGKSSWILCPLILTHRQVQFRPILKKKKNFDVG